jgi:hypothetical protein
MNFRSGVAAGLLALAAACGQNGASAPTPAAPAVAEAPAVASAAAAASVATEAPPTVNGMYVVKGACPGEGCYFGRMQATKALDLYEAPGASPKVVGQLAASEWMDTVVTEDHFAPLRGVVRTGGENFKAGDVVYRLGYEGEGCFEVWDKGQLKSWCDMGEQIPGDPGEVIDWDKAPAVTDGSEGLWVQVKSDKGAGGWLRDPEDVRCIGYQDRDADCPPLPT